MEALRRGMTLQEFVLRSLEQAVQESSKHPDWPGDQSQ